MLHLLLAALLWTAGGPPVDPPGAVPVRWTATAEPGTTTPAGIVAVVVRGEIAPGWRVYAMSSPVGRPLQIRLASAALAPLAEPHEVQPHTGHDHHFGAAYAYFEGEATVTQVFRVRTGASGTAAVEGAVTYMACSDTVCLPPRHQAVRTAVRVGSPAR